MNAPRPPNTNRAWAGTVLTALTFTLLVHLLVPDVEPAAALRSDVRPLAPSPLPPLPSPARSASSRAWDSELARGAARPATLAAVMASGPPLRSSYTAVLPPDWDPIGADFPRISILTDFAAWVLPELKPGCSVLSTWPSEPEMKFPGLAACKITPCTFNADQNEGDTCDLHVMNLPGAGTFDVIIVSQTFEHLPDPVQAARNLGRPLAPGGILFTSLPVLNRPHSVPIHTQHFSAGGFVQLFASVGLVVEKLGSWGSRDYSDKVLQAQPWWPDFREMAPGFRNAPYPNDVSGAVQQWVVVRRPPGPLAAGDFPPPRYAEPWFQSAKLFPAWAATFSTPTRPSSGTLAALLAAHPALTTVDFVSALVVAVARSHTKGRVGYFGATAKAGFTAEGASPPSVEAGNPAAPGSGVELFVVTDALENALDRLVLLRELRASLSPACTPLLLVGRSLLPLAPPPPGVPGYVASLQPGGLLADGLRAGFSLAGPGSAGFWGTHSYAMSMLYGGHGQSAVELGGVDATALAALGLDDRTHGGDEAAGNALDLVQRAAAVHWLLLKPCTG